MLNLLVFPENESINQQRVCGYLKTMIGNMSNNEVRTLLRFITGSSVCSAKRIEVTYNTLSGFARRPIAHTCDCTLQLPSTYINYDDFFNEFRIIIDKVNEEYSFRMDAL